MTLNSYNVKILNQNEKELLQRHMNANMDVFKPSGRHKIVNIPNIILITNPIITEENLIDIFHSEIPILFLTTCESMGDFTPIADFFNCIYGPVSKNKFFSELYYCKKMMKCKQPNIVKNYMTVPFRGIKVTLIHNKIIMYLTEIFILLKELIIFDITTSIYKLYIDILFKKNEK